MSFFFESLVRIASYGPLIDKSHGENRLSHIIMYCIVTQTFVTLPPKQKNSGLFPKYLAVLWFLFFSTTQ